MLWASSMGTFDEILCPCCGQWRTSKYWNRIARGARPLGVARLREGLGYRYGFRTLKIFEDYRFFYPDFVVIRNQLFDALTFWFDKGILSELEFKMAFPSLFTEERAKANLSFDRTLPFLQLRKNLFHKGKTENVIL